MPNSEKLSPSEISAVVALLSKLDPGFLPFEVFHAVSRLVATPIIELVPLRRNAAGRLEVLLLRREPDDPVWPGQLHVPGTVVRSSDAEGSFKNAFDRISRELGVARVDPVFVENILHHSGRGMEVSQIYWTAVNSAAPMRGTFYPVDSLPRQVVSSQLGFIADAARHCMARR